ncbi:MAG TPA: 2-amino-4-hydroxy-6-hydroxymethyldihydropteridine diphosphokinase [Candidatus Angelobacter sp.]|nr:2-amino-4-hydroxy-6-hydroxymethyldihydropteridine diphosphokinase [Candidatus Angelobacter sp.]
MAWVALGANLGNRTRQLALLRELLLRDGVRIDAASEERLTRAVGVTNQPDFLNQVVKLRAPAPWAPRQWLEHTQRAEHDAGRRTTYRWGPRRADADILLLGEDGAMPYSDGALTVPHPSLPERPFFVEMLAELGCRA